MGQLGSGHAEREVHRSSGVGVPIASFARTLVVFWLIDRKRESLELLSDFLEAIPDAEMHGAVGAGETTGPLAPTARWSFFAMNVSNRNNWS